MPQGTCSFGGILLTANQRYADASESFIIPEKDVEFVEVPGKDGSIMFDNNRYKNVIIPVNIFIRRAFMNNYRSLVNILNATKGYQKLKLPYRTDAYRLGVFHSSIVFETGPWLNSGTVTLNFNCKPFWYLNEGDEWVNCPGAQDTSFSNTTPYPAKPLIRFYGNGSLKMNGEIIINTFGINTSEVPYVDVDCETMTISYEGTNMASNCIVYEYSPDVVGMVRGFPEFPAFTNFVLTPGPGTTPHAEVKPRWVML